MEEALVGVDLDAIYAAFCGSARSCPESLNQGMEALDRNGRMRCGWLARDCGWGRLDDRDSGKRLESGVAKLREDFRSVAVARLGKHPVAGDDGIVDVLHPAGAGFRRRGADDEQADTAFCALFDVGSE